MNKFPSIESFTHFVRYMRQRAEFLNVPVEALPPVKFRGTVKLHGTNAGVEVVVDGTVRPQSRDIMLTNEHTNFGHKGFVDGIEVGKWNSLAQKFLAVNNVPVQTEAVTMFGEWCGQGIQRGTALTECPKHFVIFGASHGGTMLPTMVEPDPAMNEHGIYFINQIPSYEVDVNPNDFQAASDYLNELTAAIELECPWAKTMFDVSGVGEGLVWLPVDVTFADNDHYRFKTKGAKHKARANPRGDVAPVDVEKVNSIKECVNIVLTENRMEQMVNDNNLPLVPESIGPFLKALSADIIKEESAVIEENGLTWKEVGKLVQSNARTWFMNRVTQSTLSQ